MDISENAVIAISKKISDLASAAGEFFTLYWDSTDETGVPEKREALIQELRKHCSGRVEESFFAGELIRSVPTDEQGNIDELISREELPQIIRNHAKKVSEDHWVALPLTPEDTHHDFSTDMDWNFSEDYDFETKNLESSGPQQRGFIPLSKRLAVLEPEASLLAQFREEILDKGWLRAFGLPDASSFLCIKVNGYSNGLHECPLFRNRYQALAKAVILTSQWGNLGHLRKNDVYISNHPRERASFVYQPSAKLPVRIQSPIDEEINFELSALSTPNWSYSLNTNGDVIAVGDIEESKKAFFNARSPGVEKLIDDYDHYVDLINAAQWCFDSGRTVAEEPVKAFLFLGIAWDALLGSKGGSANVTSTLVDRLAYLISETREERDEILRGFKTFYQVRSKVVHGRLAWLDQEEKDSYRWGFDAFKKAFERELLLI